MLPALILGDLPPVVILPFAIGRHSPSFRPWANANATVKEGFIEVFDSLQEMKASIQPGEGWTRLDFRAAERVGSPRLAIGE
jgi:hypothetical protein